MSRGGRGKISRFVRDDKRVLFVESFGENQDKLARNLFGMLRLMADWKLNHYPKLVLKSPKWGVRIFGMGVRCYLGAAA